jgi:hypothetical protein
MSSVTDTIAHLRWRANALGVCTERRECVAPHPGSWNMRPKAKSSICSAIRGQPHVGLRCFMSTTAATTSRLAPFGPGFFGTVDENSRRYFPGVSARWRRRTVEGFRTMAARTSRLGRMSSSRRRPLDRRGGGGERCWERLTISRRCSARTDSATMPRPPTGTGEPGNGRPGVENQDGQVAHGPMLTNWRNRKKC